MEVIGKINVNFSVSSDNPKYLYITDLSDWVYSENLPSYVEIIIPGSKKVKTYSFKKHKNNIFNSHNLGLSCFKGDCNDENYVDLPDGIYSVCVKSGYENIEDTKYYLKTDKFEIEYGEVVTKVSLDNLEQNFINLMLKIKYILDVAKYHTMLGNFMKANRYFEESSKLLRRFKECKDCL